MSETATTPRGCRTRVHVLKAAMELFNTRGYHATSMADIIKACGVQKGNLYFHFKSKEDLALALIEDARREYLCYLRAHARGEGALGKIGGVLDAVFDFHHRKNFVGGCIFGNMALEMGDTNPQFTSLIKDIFREWTDLVKRLLEEAKTRGELPQEADAGRLARHIVACLEGGIMLSRLTKDGSDMRGCIESVKAMLMKRPAENDRGIPEKE